MNPADLLFLAFALSVDAFVVAFSFGLIIKKNRFRNGMEISLATGGGQFLMPVLGFFLTGTVHGYIAEWDHWLGFAVFTILGINVIREGWNHRTNKELPDVSSLTAFTLLGVGIATSIDALVAGISIYLPRRSTRYSYPRQSLEPPPSSARLPAFSWPANCTGSPLSIWKLVRESSSSAWE